MIDAHQKAGTKLVIGFQYRYDPRTEFLVAQRERACSATSALRGCRRCGGGHPQLGRVRAEAVAGGGPMIDIGVHVLEMCHFTMGSPRPVAATGMTDTYLGDQPSDQIKSVWAGWDYKTYTVEDLAVGSIRFENGAVIHLEASFAAHHEHSGTMNFQVMGTKGGAIWRRHRLFTDMNGYMMNLQPAYVPKLPTGGFAGYFHLKLRNFVDHVLKGEPTMAPAEHGLMVLADARRRVPARPSRGARKWRSGSEWASRLVPSPVPATRFRRQRIGRIGAGDGSARCPAR